MGLHPYAIGMFVVGYDLEAGHLAQFVSKYPTKIIERPSTANGQCYVLLADLVDKHVRLKIEVDRGHNYLIRRVTYLANDDRPMSKHEVLSFATCEGGVYVPKSTKVELAADGARQYWNMKVRQVNKTIDESTFKVEFPEWTRVSDTSTGAVLLWGKGEQVHRVFPTPGPVSGVGQGFPLGFVQ